MLGHIRVEEIGKRLDYLGNGPGKLKRGSLRETWVCWQVYNQEKGKWVVWSGDGEHWGLYGKPPLAFSIVG
jgi:hypothetical protein